MARYDDAAKHHLLQNAETLLPFLLEAPDVTVLKRLDTEQPTLKTHHADSTWEISIGGEESISHVEVQTHNSRVPMQFRLAGYHGFLVAEHKKPVRCTVVYLHPKAGRNDPGGYGYEWNGEPCYLLTYRVVRLIEIDGASILALQAPGLMPFTPLMQPPEGMSAERWLKECIDATASLSVAVEHRHDLMALLGMFGKLTYDEGLIASSITEDMMSDSPFFQRYAERYAERHAERYAEKALKSAVEDALQKEREHARARLEQERAQCERDTTIRTLLRFLEARFQPTAVQALKPLLETIEDVEQLEQLASAAASAESLEMFLAATVNDSRPSQLDA